MAIELRNIDPVIFLHDVGIGTTSPNTRLHVTTSGGNQMVLEDSAAGLNLKKWILNSEAGTLGVKLVNDAFSSSQTFVSVLSSGNVGIGTTSPSARLDVYSATNLGAGANGIRVQRPGSYGQYGYLEYLVSSDMTVLGSLYTGGGAGAFGQLTFRQHSSTTSRDAMVLDSSGNLGIGTTAPSTPLHLYANNAVTSAPGLKIEQAGAGDAQIHFLLPGATDWAIGIDNSDSDKFKIGYANDLANSNAVTITTTGNVGIGTTEPGQKLSVLGTIRGQSAGGRFLDLTTSDSGVNWQIWASAGSTNDEFRYGSAVDSPLTFYTNNAEVMRMKSGNVGIGTTGPINKLHLYNGTESVGATQLELEGRFNAYGAGINFSSRTSSGGTLVAMAKITADGEEAWNTTGTTQNAGLRFSTTLNGTLAERLRIDSFGNVGIGTTAPSQKLHVEGNIKLTGSLKFSDGSSFPNAGTTFPRTMACPIDGARGVYDNDVLWMCDFLYANTNTSFKQMGTNGSHTGGTAYTLASILTTVGAASVGGGHQTATWGDSFMLQISNTTKTYGVPTAYIVVALPCDKNFHNVLHVKTVSHDRWESINGWICNSGGTIQQRLQAHTNAGNGSGGGGFTSCPGPRNQIGKISCCHEWQSIIIPKDYLELYAYSNGASPTGFSVKIALNAGVNSSYDHFWIAGLGISRNPTGFTHINSIDMHWATNGGNTVHWNGNWEYSSMNTLLGRTNYEDIRVPIAGIDRDLLVGFLAHGANWRVAGPICWVQGNQDTTYGNATYYLSKAVIGTFGMVEGNQTNHSLPMGFIVPKEIVASYYNNTNGLRTLPLRIFNTQNDHSFYVRAMYTEQVNRIGNDKTIPGNAFNMKNNNYSTSSLVNLSTYDGG